MASNGVSQRRCDLQRIGHLYRREAPYGVDVCTYCGDPATTLDHVMPISRLAAAGDMLATVIQKYPHALVIVPACRDCNCRLGGVVCRSISEKREILKKKLRIKHKRLLGSYDWDDEELSQLGHSLRTYIKAQEIKREWVLQRLRFPTEYDKMMRRVWR